MHRQLRTASVSWGRSAAQGARTVRRHHGVGVMLLLAGIPLAGVSACSSSGDATGPEGPNQMQGPVPVLLLRGSFHDVVAKGSGTAEIVKATDGTRTLNLTGFQVDNGPALVVYMVAADDATDSPSVTNAGFVSLGALKSISGDQMYPIPDDLDLDTYRAVTIWCVAFVANWATAPVSPFGN